MSYLERIILLIYFPQFSRPNISRFESFFHTIKRKEYHINNSNDIFPEKIIRNEDKRTSIIIEGFPKDISKSEVRNMLGKYGNINYLYINRNIKNCKKGISSAFINYINYKSIIPLFMNFRNSKIERKGKILNLKIYYSKIQGKNNIKKYIQRNNYYNQSKILKK